MKNVEDLFPLTPMQRVMLLHSRAHSGGHDALFHQFRFDLEGTPDASALEAAWNDAVALHPALRTCFVWEGVDEPLQVVRATAQVAFSISDAESDDALEAIRASDRARGFDLTRAPLIRLALVRRGEARATLLWSSHHLVLDRWCIGIVLADVAAAYGARRRGEEPPEPRRGRFRDYVAHVLGVPGSEVAAHWRRELAGARAAFRELDGASMPGRAARTLDGDDLTALRDVARSVGVTAPALAQVALALVLAEHSGNGDVVFGATVAGRPPDVRDVETTVGTMIGNVPVRVRLDPGASVADAARALLRAAQSRVRYEFASPTDLHGHAGLRADERLFDALLVQLDATRAGELDGLRITAERGAVESPFPLTVSVEDAGGALRIEAATSATAGLGADAWANALTAMLMRVVAGPRANLAELAAFRAPIALETPTSAGNGAHAAPRTASKTSPAGRERDGLEIVEEFVFAEAARVLGVDAVDPDVSFFDQGGTSLTATQLHARIEAG
ncbi:MAG: condensation domain-containing protein, partial [Planctomycetota bacterium]